VTDAPQGDADALVDGQRVTTSGDMESSAGASDAASTGETLQDDAASDAASGTTPDASGDSAASARTQDEIDRSEHYA
jgi:hypothetical protein